MYHRFNLIGSAFGHGAQIYTTNTAPIYLKNKYTLTEKLGNNFRWYNIIDNINALETLSTKGRNYHAVLKHNTELAATVARLVQIPDELCVVIGGDHSCGIGTWSGATQGLDAQDNFGLIWIDAHMDAHTYATSPSKSYHGMPLAILLGQGDAELCNIGFLGRKIKPENLVLIGVRSFENGECAFLKSNNVRIFYEEEVRKRGIQVIFQEALDVVTYNTKGFGMSIDLDAFDPLDAPGVGSPAPNGLRFQEVVRHLPSLLSSVYLRCLEITEFNPELDVHDKTADVLFEILRILR